MRYQSFYPFSNQQRPMTPGPPPPRFQGGGTQQPFPRGMQGNAGSFGPQGSPQGSMPSQGMPQSQAGQSGGSRADQYMQTANRFLNTAQQFAPLVQQVAPMLQNLPAMWKLYKGFQSMPDAPAPPSASPINPAAPRAQAPPIPNDQPAPPRIYQPPF
ncbi:VrrA/YqfQ family protein [Sporosarcina sp. GW1-11]|uniref:VrrA/YqfQ family protein n=1 Tax=Sporosarcina sp. GW1-11 TaxID=2899126 RepID=UPI00294BC250|nr:VrrA/YqfQ family protein [Sporosarcina sp. GW1-11]MDV6377924.1 VrrA/YqfQ family protein [Sporosarcina sp. GW1-11]